MDAIAPRATTLLGSGASRSRRYAVSAAFLAGSAAFACGQTSDDDGANNTAGSGGDQTEVTTGGRSSNQGGSKSNQGGSKSNQGGSTTGEGGKDVGTGGSATGGVVTIPVGGQTQSTGGVATMGGSAGSNATGRACGDYADRNGCHDATECETLPTSSGPATCVLAAPSSPCGNPMFLPQCPDQGCGDASVCVQQTCGSQCVAACTETSCPAGSQCLEGQCQAVPCGETQVRCPDGFECDFDATGPGNHCVPESCATGDFECEPWQDCAQRPGVDAHGCVAHVCTADADCGDCGYCVNAECAPQLGICHQLIAMPYGCVWPDEELF